MTHVCAEGVSKPFHATRRQQAPHTQRAVAGLSRHAAPAPRCLARERSTATAPWSSPSQALESLVTPQNPSRARLAMLCGTQPVTEPAALPQQLHGLAENMPVEGQGKASASERPYGGSLLLWQPRGSTAEAACRARWGSPSERLARGAGGRLLQAGKQRRTEEKFFATVK